MTDILLPGWGKITPNGRMHHTLQQAQSPVVSNQACANSYRSIGKTVSKSHTVRYAALWHRISQKR